MPSGGRDANLDNFSTDRHLDRHDYEPEFAYFGNRMPLTDHISSFCFDKYTFPLF